MVSLHMPPMHLPDSPSVLGMVFGVIFAPVVVLGILFLIVKAVVGIQ